MRHNLRHTWWDARTRVAACIAFAMASAPEAANLHVSPTGSDDAAGTAGLPFATLAKAASISAPGDTIWIHEGTYRIAAQLEPKSGKAGSPVVYKAAPGDHPLVDGTSGYVATLAARSHIRFEGIRFTTSDTAVGAGMFYFENSLHIEFHRCEFFGMPAQRGGENTAVIRCMSSGYPDEQNQYNSDSCVFRNNVFRDNAAPAFRLYDTKGWRIENNRFENCEQAVGGKDEPYDLLVRRNLVIGGQLAFYFALQGGGDGVTVTENIVVGTSSGFNIGGLGTYGNKRKNVRVFNNTFHNVSTSLYGWTEPQYDTSIGFWNNIFESDSAANIPGGADVGARFVSLNKYQKVPMNPTQYWLDYNDYLMPALDRSTWFIDGAESFNGLSAWTMGRAPFDAHSLSTDPLFVDPKKGDFHLGSSSPCKGKGRSGEDLGAYPRGDDGTVIGPVGETGTSSLHPSRRVAKPSAPQADLRFRADGTPASTHTPHLTATLAPGSAPSLSVVRTNENAP